MTAERRRQPDTRMTDAEYRRAEEAAMATLRKRFRLRAAGPGKFDALCPAHEDHNRSLRVYSVGGKLMFRCYAGCAFNAVRVALGLPVWHGTRRPASDWRPALPLARPAPAPGEPAYDFAELAERFALDGPGLAPLAAELGVSTESLLDAGAGHTGGALMYVRKLGKEIPIDAWAFPMVDAYWNVTGLRLRYAADGQKGSWTGSVPGLFAAGRRWLPAQPLAVVEGPTDRAAVWDWGFNAIGKPSCNDGDGIVVDFIRNLYAIGRRPVRVVVLMNVDAPKRRPGTGEIFHPGQDGARALCDRIAAAFAALPLRLVAPPAGYKDARQWKTRGGGTRAHVDALIAAQRDYVPQKQSNRRSA